MQQKNGKTSRSPRRNPPSQTKFDVWLEDHLRTGEQVTLMLAEDPLFIQHGKVRVVVDVITVDRYFIYCRINGEGNTDSHVWIAKVGIISAA